ncbi:hypothetical protein MBLNU459_g7601t1 [Dothideomycetes sp. NU459]
MASLPTRSAAPANREYSPEVTVAAITNFYRTFIKLPYVEPGALRFPPDGGWTEVDADELKRRGKTDAVIDLLRHLPYLENKVQYDRWTIHDGCVGIDYHKGLCYEDNVDPIRNLPAHVIPVAEMLDRNGNHLLLDTHTGCITDYMLLEGNLTDYDRHEALPEQDKWMAYPTAPVGEFFGRWSRLYEKLIWMVARDPLASETNLGRFFSRAERVSEENKLLDSDDEEGGSGMEDPETKEVFAIYKRNGWPSNFDRELCELELQTFLESGDEQ